MNDMSITDLCHRLVGRKIVTVREANQSDGLTFFFDDGSSLEVEQGSQVLQIDYNEITRRKVR